MRQLVSSALLVLTMVGAAGAARTATAQEFAAADTPRGPRFLVASNSKMVPVDVNRTPVLARRIKLDHAGGTLGEALADITAQSGLRLVYGNDVVPLGRRLEVRADGITVAAALTDVLFGTDVDVVFDQHGNAALVRRPAPRQNGAVQGQVTDGKTGQGLGDAEVILEGTGSRVLTSAEGRFRIADVTPGSYTLLVRRLGYGAARRPVTVGDGQEVTIDVALEPRPTQLDEVVVAGTLTPTAVKALPTPVSVITAEQIEEQHIRRYDQLLRQLVPGLVAWEGGTTPEATSMSVRGASSLTGLGLLKVYVDGVQVAHNYAAQLDPQSIERMEVIRGPQAAAIYGSDAIGGVIEIFTKRGDPSLQRLEGSVQVAAGGIQSRYRDGVALRQDYKAELRGASGNASFNLGGGFSRDGEWIDRYAAERPSVNGGMRFERGPFGVDLTARYVGQNYHYPFNPALRETGFSSFQTPSATRYQARDEAYGVQLRYRVTPTWQHQLIVGVDRSSYMNEEYEAPLRTPTDTLLSFQEIWGNRLSVAYRSALTARLSPAINAVVTAGFDYNLYRYSYFLYGGIGNLTGTIQTSPGSLILAARERTTNAGYFTQAQVGLHDALFLTASARLEQNSNFGDEGGTPVSPRVGLSYVQALGGTTVKLRSAYGEALKAPASGMKMGSRYGSYITEPNPALRPERQVGPEFGTDLVFGSRASLGVTYYRQTARDLIAQVVLAPIGTTLVDRFENVGRVRNEGVELEGRVDLAGVQLTGQYAYTSSTLLDPGPSYTGEERVGEQISSVPQHTAGATLSFAPLRRLGVTAGMAFVGSLKGVDWFELYRCLGGTAGCGDYLETGNLRAFWARIPSFAKFNLAVDYELRSGLTSYLAVENLANSNPAERYTTSALPGRITTVGLRMRY